MPALATTDAFTLDTDRLLLRRHRREDFDECAAMWADPVVTRHIGGRPFTVEEVWTKLLRYVGHWSVLGFGYWAVRERATGRFVGEVGFADFKRDMMPSIAGVPEAGWVLSPWSHGQGFATEAVQGALGWLDARGQARSVCIIDPTNAPSLRVAQKCGYDERERAHYKGQPTILFERQAGLRVPVSAR